MTLRRVKHGGTSVQLIHRKPMIRPRGLSEALCSLFDTLNHSDNLDLGNNKYAIMFIVRMEYFLFGNVRNFVKSEVYTSQLIMNY